MASGDAYNSWDDGGSGSWNEPPAPPRGDTSASSWSDLSSSSVPAQRTGTFQAIGSHQYPDEPSGRQPLPPAPDVFRRRGVGGKDKWPVWGRTLFVIGVCFVVLVVVHLFFYQVFSVRASSMSPTLQAGDRVLVNKVVYDFRDPHRGEIILFHGDAPKWTPESSTDNDSGLFANISSAVGSWVGFSSQGSDEFFRRVIAVPGDTIACCDVNHHVFVNGKPLNETYVQNDSPLSTSKTAPPCGARQFAPAKVLPGNVFVMGDNRVASLDSRCIQQVPMSKIVGRASNVIFGRWASLSVPSTFNDVPKPYGLGETKPVPVTDQGGWVVLLPLVAGLAGYREFGRVTKRRRRNLRA